MFTDSADVVLVTHEHSDHNDLTRVKQRSTARVIRAANALINGVYQTIPIGNVTVTGVPAYNNNHSKAACVGYVVEFDGIKLYHAGDTGNIPEMADLAARHITYALLPMDGVYTISPETATQAAAAIQAMHDIPIHTMPPPDTYADAIVARFTSPNKMIVRPGSTIDLSAVTRVSDPSPVPTTVRLEQNFPNPFNPSTWISFSIPSAAFVTLTIYDVQGRDIATLVSGELQSGRYSRQWIANGVPSGIYFYRLQAGSSTVTKKLLLTK